MYCVKLLKPLYGLKLSDQMWYNRLSEFLKLKGYINNNDCPCVFIKKSSAGFCIISIYIDDQNIKLLHVDTLRKGMYVLNQDPFLFDGTIRENLDPKKCLTDLELWQAIEECDGKAIILKLGNQLQWL